MKIFIITLGTRGDVQPYVALGKGLKAAGHDVTVCASSSFEPFITEHGLQYGYMNDELVRFIHSAEGRYAIENMTNLINSLKHIRKMLKQVEPIQWMALRDSWNSAQQAHPDLIIYHPKATGAPHFAEKLGIPAILALPLPIHVPTSEFTCFVFPHWKLGGWYNKLTHNLLLKISTKGMGKFINVWRKEQNLPPQPKGIYLLHSQASVHHPVLFAFSKFVVPVPADWQGKAEVTGYWFLDGQDAWQPPVALQDFLNAGAPPVYVGFGSMAGRNPERITRIVVEALQQAKVRGVLASGWGGLAASDLPDTIHTIDDAPHEWLFPRMVAVVHHGGSGTTAAGLRAGRPTIICPFIADQPFWGRRVEVPGVGPAPIPRKKLTTENLAAAIREVTSNPIYQKNAEALGEKIRSEDGVTNAVTFIERIIHG